MSVKIYVGDCRPVMAGMRAKSVHCAVTSPPYWGLRDYDTEPTIWGGDEECDHLWGDEKIVTNTAPRDHNGAYDWSETRGTESKRKALSASTGQFCHHCNAWRGNLGLEPTPQLFVEHIVEVMRGAWRVLRDDGVLWLNLGDSYNGGGTYHGDKNAGISKSAKRQKFEGTTNAPGLKPKDLIGIPWRVALALQADGWYLRSAMPWVKGNPMPESVRDRPTNAHEFVFLLSKSNRYFYDGESVKVGLTARTLEQVEIDKKAGLYDAPRAMGISGKNASPQGKNAKRDERCRTMVNGTGRNRRTSDTFRESLALRIHQQRQYLAHLEHVQANGGMMVDEDGGPVALLVNTSGYSGAHFATFPTKLIQPLIAAGTSEKGCCSECGSPWERVIEKEGLTTTEKKKAIGSSPKRGDGGKLVTQNLDYAGGHGSNIRESKTTGWRPTCECYDDRYYLDFQQAKSARKRRQRLVSGDWFKRARKRAVPFEWPIEKCTVFDPFGGSGTTALQADRMGRDAVIIELNETYATELAYNRIAGDVPMFADVEIVTQPSSNSLST